MGNYESGVMFKDYAKDRKKKKHLSFRYQSRAMEAGWALRKYGTGVSNPQILDLGCADGLTMALLHKLASAGRSIGIEYTQELVDSAEPMPEGCSIQQGDGAELPKNLRKSNFTSSLLWPYSSTSTTPKRSSIKFMRACPRWPLRGHLSLPIWTRFPGNRLHKEEYHFTDFRWPRSRTLR